MTLDYGTCPCTGNYETRFVQASITVEGRIIVLNDVPQGVCPLCGSRVYKLDLLEYIEAAMKGKRINMRSA